MSGYNCMRKSRADLPLIDFAVIAITSVPASDLFQHGTVRLMDNITLSKHCF